jgi:hypothetical protein
MSRGKPRQFEKVIQIKMTARERERLYREAERRGVNMSELIRGWIHRLKPLEDEFDPVDID